MYNFDIHIVFFIVLRSNKYVCVCVCLCVLLNLSMFISWVNYNAIIERLLQMLHTSPLILFRTNILCGAIICTTVVSSRIEVFFYLCLTLSALGMCRGGYGKAGICAFDMKLLLGWSLFLGYTKAALLNYKIVLLWFLISYVVWLKWRRGRFY